MEPIDFIGQYTNTKFKNVYNKQGISVTSAVTYNHKKCNHIYKQIKERYFFLLNLIKI